MTIFILVELSL